MKFHQHRFDLILLYYLVSTFCWGDTLAFAPPYPLPTTPATLLGRQTLSYKKNSNVNCQLEHLKATPSITKLYNNKNYNSIKSTRIIQYAKPPNSDDDDDENYASPDSFDDDDFIDNYYDDLFDPKRTASLIGGQSLLIGIAVVIASLVGTPNYGFGPGISFTSDSFLAGTLWTIPLCIVAVVLDPIEDKYPPLQKVTMATQRSVIALLGGSFKPMIAIPVSIALGLAAGFGEEVLFRGVLQYGIAGAEFLVGNVNNNILAVVSSSIIFGLLHAVTPLYAIMASIASFYFGALYIATGNLAIPIFCHAVYDVGALIYTHWTVSKLSKEEQLAICVANLK